jgi:hypothetical protein
MKGYRTLIFNILSAILGVLAATDPSGLGLTENQSGVLVTGVAVGNILLRAITTTPIGKKD